MAVKNNFLARCKSAVTWYKGFTTLGGLTQVRESDNQASRSAWAAIFLIGCTMTCVSLRSSIEKYFKYGIVVKYNVVRPDGRQTDALG